MNPKLIAQLTLALIFICLALFMCNKLTCTSHHPKPQTQLLDSLTKIQHIQNQHLQILQAEKAQAYHLADSILAINTTLVSIKTLMPKRKSITEGHQCPSVISQEKGKVCIDTNLYDSIQTICTQKEQLLNQSLAIILQLKTNDSLQTIANSIKDSATTATIAQLKTHFVEPDKMVKPKRFSVNLSGGYGYTWGATTPAPQIGLTVGLKLFSF
jgi:hypothetical protein